MSDIQRPGGRDESAWESVFLSVPGFCSAPSNPVLPVPISLSFVPTRCHRRGTPLRVARIRDFPSPSCSRVAVTSPLSSVHSRLSWSRIPRGHCRKHSTNEGLGRVRYDGLQRSGTDVLNFRLTLRPRGLEPGRPRRSGLVGVQGRSAVGESSLAQHSLSAHFGYFFSRLNPSPSFEAQASSEYNTNQGPIENPIGLAAALRPKCFLQGSYASRLPYTPLTTSMS